MSKDTQVPIPPGSTYTFQYRDGAECVPASSVTHEDGVWRIEGRELSGVVGVTIEVAQRTPLTRPGDGTPQGDALLGATVWLNHVVEHCTAIRADWSDPRYAVEEILRATRALAEIDAQRTADTATMATQQAELERVVEANTREREGK